MVVRIAGKGMYLWRAVDDEGEVLGKLVQRRRDKRAALRLMRKLLRKLGFALKLLVTNKLGSYGRFSGNSACPAHMSRVGAALPQHPSRRPQHIQSSPLITRSTLRTFRAKRRRNGRLPSPREPELPRAFPNLSCTSLARRTITTTRK
jgi:transposase-like protein